MDKNIKNVSLQKALNVTCFNCEKSNDTNIYYQVTYTNNVKEDVVFYACCEVCLKQLFYGIEQECFFMLDCIHVDFMDYKKCCDMSEENN